MDAHHRIGVGGFAAGGDAAPLVDRHIHDHRARLHAPYQSLIHQGGGAAAGQQHGADQQVGPGHQPLDQGAAAHQGDHPTAAVRFQAPQPLGRAVQQEHLRIHGGGDPCGVPAHRASAQHHHPSRAHAGAAPHQDAAAAMGLLQQVRPHLGRQPAGDLAHRRQQRQAAVLELHGFVGDGGGSRLQQSPAHLRVGGQVEIGEEHQVGPQEAELLRLRLLHLHHQVGRPGVLAAHQPGAGGGVVVIADADPVARPRLDAHLHPLAHQLPHPIGGEGHPLLIALDLPRHADAGHRGDQGSRQAGGCHGRSQKLWLNPRSARAMARRRARAGSTGEQGQAGS